MCICVRSLYYRFDDQISSNDWRGVKYVDAYLNPFTLEWGRLNEGQAPPTPDELILVSAWCVRVNWLKQFLISVLLESLWAHRGESRSLSQQGLDQSQNAQTANRSARNVQRFDNRYKGQLMCKLFMNKVC